MWNFCPLKYYSFIELFLISYRVTWLIQQIILEWNCLVLKSFKMYPKTIYLKSVLNLLSVLDFWHHLTSLETDESLCTGKRTINSLLSIVSLCNFYSANSLNFRLTELPQCRGAHCLVLASTVNTEFVQIGHSCTFCVSPVYWIQPIKRCKHLE